MKIKVGIVGAAGYTGAELVRLLLDHPYFDITCITSDASVGRSLVDMYPAFEGQTDLRFSEHTDPALDACDIVFLAVPHKAAMQHAPKLLEKGISVIDLSADFRLKDATVYQTYYDHEHTAQELLTTRFFGLPELFPDDMEKARKAYAQKQAVLIACAGCYPTASSLAAFPARELACVDAPIIVDAISGVTGAGKKATERTHYCSVDENLEAYSVVSHRHTPEIEQILGKPGQIIFSPHLAPLKRGLLSTVYITLKSDITLEEVRTHYQNFYANSPFVQVLSEGLPKTASVVGTNNAHVGLAYDQRTQTLIAVGAIDNLCKGASGQAIQCANIMCDLPQQSGLPHVSMSV